MPTHVRFYDLGWPLTELGFDERVKGSHHIFTKPEVVEILNLQPADRWLSLTRLNRFAPWSFVINWRTGFHDKIRDHFVLERWRSGLANAEMVIAEWLDTARELGRPIPEPKHRLLYDW